MSLKVVNAQTVYDSVVGQFKQDNIPLSNIVSSLSDSAHYMRGKHTGLETLLRSGVRQLLDIGGDICHTVHNIVKHFSKHFGNYVEQFDDDLHNDTKWSPDVKGYLKDICNIIGVKYLTPRQRVVHRWLSA